MRANADEGRGWADVLCDREAAAPIEGFDFVPGDCLCPRKILTTREPRDFGGRRPAEDFVLRTLRCDAAAREDNELIAQAIRFFDVVGDEERWAAVFSESLLQLSFDLAAQVSIERRERFVEKQRLWLSGQGARQSDALLFTA